MNYSIALPAVVLLTATPWALCGGPADTALASNPTPSIYTLDSEARFAHLQADSVHRMRAFAEAVQHVRAQGDAERTQLAAAASWVVAHCPYTAATVDLVALLDDSLPPAACATENTCSSADSELEPLEVLTRTLRAHVALLRELGVDPAAGRDAAPATPERFLTLEAQLQSVRARVAALPEDVQERLTSKKSLLDEATAGMWIDKGALIDYRAQMEALALPPAAACEKPGDAPRLVALAPSVQQGVTQGVTLVLAEQWRSAISLYLTLYC